MEGGQAPAGWYQDPSDERQMRYWDGVAWTEHRSPSPTPSPATSAPEVDERSEPHGSELDRLIEELAASKLNSRMGVRKELRKLPSLLNDRERVITLAAGLYDEVNGLVVATDRRVMFVGEGVLRSRLEDFPYEKISSVQTEKGLMLGSLIIFASGNKAVIKNMAKDRAAEFGDYVRSRISTPAVSQLHTAPRPRPPPPSEADRDVYEQLRKLGELRDMGVLTDEEFAEKKADLLDRL